MATTAPAPRNSSGTTSRKAPRPHVVSNVPLRFMILFIGYFGLLVGCFPAVALASDGTPGGVLSGMLLYGVFVALVILALKRRA